MPGLAAKRAEERWPGGVAGAVKEVEVPDDDPEWAEENETDELRPEPDAAEEEAIFAFSGNTMAAIRDAKMQIRLVLSCNNPNAKRCTDRTGCQNVHSAERRDRKRVSQHVDRVWVRRAID